ncbi:MAG: flavin-containing monooxygenase [Solirubrobacterales bacterium]
MAALREGQRACVIGAGSSGIACCQVLDAHGIPFDCFEKGSYIGGNWRYQNDNGVSSAYKSLHINTSRRVMAFSTYPMPEDYPDYPRHELMAKYFDDYADHFGIREKVRFRTEVKSVEPAPGAEGEWDVTIEAEDGSRETNRYGAVLVANGHHWDPRWPEPPFPGSETFTGEQMHVHHYKEADVLEGKRVLILGIGNSSCDIAVESSRIAQRTFLAMRRSAYVIPKYIGGKPIDESAGPAFSRLPLSVQRALMGFSLRRAQGKPTDYGLPEPDHKLLGAHPTVSSELLPRIGHGDITVKPNIERFDGGTVHFVDGTSEQIDLVIYCTGYKVSFPFLDPAVFSAPDNRLDLYQRVVSPDLEGLYFIGFLQPLGPIMPLAELQAEWVADLLEGKASLPSPEKMRKAIDREQAKMRKRYVASKRHTVEVDFHPYMRTIKKERRRSRA